MKDEDKLILVFSRTNLDGREMVKVEKLLGATLDWDYIFRKCREEGVCPLIYNHLNHLNDSKFKAYIPRAILGAFERDYYENCARNTLICEEAGKILDAFNQENIKTILLKGVFLAESIYKNLALRPMTDIDILIRKADLGKANEVLKRSGYSVPPNYEDFLGNSLLSSINSLTYKASNSINFPVHLHWHLINSTWPLDFLVSKIDMERIWSCAEPAKVNRIDTLTLAPHHLLIYLGQHSFNHSFDRAILLSDILEILRYYKTEPNWDLLIEDAEAFSLSSVLHHSLFFASRLLSFEAAGLEKLSPRRSGFLEKMLSFCACRHIRSEKLSYLAYLFMQKGFSRRSKFIAKTILPSPYVMAHIFALPKSRITVRHYYQRISRNIRARYSSPSLRSRRTIEKAHKKLETQ